MFFKSYFNKFYFASRYFLRPSESVEPIEGSFNKATVTLYASSDFSKSLKSSSAKSKFMYNNTILKVILD